MERFLDKRILSPGKPWNLVFASPGKKHLNVFTNPAVSFHYNSAPLCKSANGSDKDENKIIIVLLLK